MTTKKLPRNWSLCTLGDIGTWGSGGTPLRSHNEYYNGTIPWLKIGDLEDGNVLKSETYITEKGLKNSSAKVLDIDTLLIAMYGSIGKLGITKIKCATNQAIAYCVPNESKILLKFLFHFLLFNRNNFFKLAKGGTQQNISQTVLKAYPICLPSLKEQHRIVEKIEKLFKQIDSSVASLQKTQEKIAQFRESLIDKVLNSLPSNTFLGEILKPKRERIIPNEKNKDIIFIGMDCIEPNSLFPFKTYTLSDTKSSCFAFSKNDVLYGRMRSYLNKVFKAEFDGTASAEFIVFPPTGKILPDYLKYVLHQRRFVKFASRNASGDRPRVTFEDDLSQFGLFIPSLPEQRKIVAEIEKQFAAADKMQKAVDNALENAKKLKQAILKKAFNGELVPQDPKDEPAATLLAKIKAERAAKSKTNLKQSKRTSK